MSTLLQPAKRAQILDAIASHAGLHFPPERWPDVERGLQAVEEEFGLAAMDKLVPKILSPYPEPMLMEAIARHLTVGETYFMRDPATLEVVRKEILAPLLIQQRRESGHRFLRLWSAGCCTGEEAYSLAIVVSELLPDLADWQVTIVGSDINRTFLQTAEAGIYKKWSFRGTSEEFQNLHFTSLPQERRSILPRYRQMVSFRFLNLAGDCYPSTLTGIENLDLIFCRNVLIYFCPEKGRSAGRRLLGSLAPSGWLVASAAEPSAIFAPLTPVTFPGVIVYRNLPALPIPPPEIARPEKPNEPLCESSSTPASAEPCLEDLISDCRGQANAGDLQEALRLCDLALFRNRLNPALHYLRGSILQEAERLDEAGKSFRRAVHLDHRFVPAYYALGTLAGKKGKRVEQVRHFESALQILRSSPPDQIVPESSGMTAARLAELIVTSMESPT